MARTIRERMNVRDNEVFTPTDPINAKTLSSVINSFFGTNQLEPVHGPDQPAGRDQAQAAHERPQPDGLSRERAGFEVRDVRYTHYGRLCTIENAGRTEHRSDPARCACTARSTNGLHRDPYRQVDSGKVDLKGQVIHLSAEGRTTR